MYCKDCEMFEIEPHSYLGGICRLATTQAGQQYFIPNDECAKNPYLEVPGDFGCILFTKKE